MRRRTFLSGIGASSLATALAGCDVLQRDDERSDDWELRADRAIQEHRTTELAVRVVDATGEPVPDADVEILMQDHDFAFGTAVRSNWVAGTSDAPDSYLEKLVTNFNTAVLEGQHKWGSWEVERNRSIADLATQRLLSNGLSVRGHVLLWQDLTQDVVPNDVVEKLESSDPDRRGYLETRIDQHISTIVSHFAGQIWEWDFLNEHLDHHEITEAIDPESPPQESPLLVDWLETAEAAAPSGTDFYVNETRILTEDDAERRERLETLLTHLRGTSASIDGVGLQGHFDGRENAITPGELRDVLDNYADLDVDIKITEYDTYGQGWSEEAEADHLATVLKTLYSHPAATGFLMWGFWDGAHWQENAPLFRQDWSPKPAYDVYSDLIFDEWWTEESGSTDEDGYYRASAYYGNYEIRASNGTQSRTIQRPLPRPYSDVTVRIQLS